MNKEDLANQLEQLADLMGLAGENPFKIRAYEKAKDVILRQIKEEDLPAIADGKIKVAGIGEGIRGAIKEYLETGKLKALDEYQVKIPAAILALTQLPGLGAKKAKEIYENLGVQTLGELEYACKENRLVSLKGFGEATQQKLLKSLERMKQNQGKYLISDAVESTLGLEKDLSHDWQVTPIGELGRKSDIVSHFDFAVYGASSKDLEKLEKKYAAQGFHFQSIAKPFEKLEMQEQQLLMASPKVKDHIKSSGPLKTKEGEWEFSWLEDENLKRKPTARTYRRKTHGSVKGIFHNHTTASDGSASLEEMVKAAEKEGYEYIGISDHSETAVYAGGLKTDTLLEQNEEIQKLQKKVKIKIFHGVESDILQDGALDYPESVLKKLDFVVGSIHSRFQMDEKTMTERLCKALENPYITFWGHPTGRLLLGRDPYAFDWKKVLTAAKKNDVIIELNSNPQRLDVDWRRGELLQEMQIPICINPDAHAVDGLKDTMWGEFMAEKAMVDADLVFNLKSAKEVQEYFKKRR